MSVIAPEPSEDDEGITREESRQSVAGIPGAGKPSKNMPEPAEEDMHRRYRIGMADGEVSIEEVED